MTTGRALCALLVASLSARSAAAVPGPRVTCGANARCSVSALPPTLQDPEVLDYLESGLTTTLVLSLKARGEQGTNVEAVGRVDVCFEPWEEAFDVTVRMPGARAESTRLASEAELHDWWRALTLTFAVAETPRGSARVTVELIPFSEEEQADARRWFAESLRTTPGGSAGASGVPALGEVLDSLTLTSIKRQGVLRFSWSVTIGRSASPGSVRHSPREDP